MHISLLSRYYHHHHVLRHFPTGAPRASKSSQSPNLSAPPAHFDQLVCLVHCSDQHHWSAVQSTKLQFCPPWFYLILHSSHPPTVYSAISVECFYAEVFAKIPTGNYLPLHDIHYRLNTEQWTKTFKDLRQHFTQYTMSCKSGFWTI